jgi:molybdopterin synthase sulfur carrier subunit
VPRIVFTSHLGGIVPEGEAEFAGSTIGESLAGAFARWPGLESYVVDDQGRLRKHVVIFLGDRRLAAGSALATPVDEASEIFVLQALSGG